MVQPVKILEKDIEGYLRDLARSAGIGVHKQISDPRRGGTPGMPDQLLILPDAHVWWAEVKRPGTVDRYLKKQAAYFANGEVEGCSKTEIRQFREQQKLLDSRHGVTIVGTYEHADELISMLEAIYL